MLIAMTGLHASGKSYFAKNVPPKFGFKVIDKKDIVKELCMEDTNEEDYWKWYKTEYNNNPILMTSKIISRIPLDENIVLDAVHSFKEWKIINSIVPDSIIVLVTTPEIVRSNRWDEGDKEKDKERIKYWHSDYNGEQGCLLTQVSWSFNGAASIETNEINFEELLNCMNIKNNIYGNDKVRKLVRK